jgi:hypothetical protein
MKVKDHLRNFALFLMLGASVLAADKFYPDDPLQKEPTPHDVAGIKVRNLNDYYDLLQNSFTDKGKPKENGHVPAGNVNTLGEPMDGAWYTHRHYWRTMSDHELARGSGGSNPPSSDGPWTVISAKTEGISPGFAMTDAKGTEYFVKFDPISDPEMATGAEMICVRIFHALGYNTPDDYLIHFKRERLVLGSDVEFFDSEGRKRRMVARDLEKLLKKVPKASDGGYRGIASLDVPGKPIGGFKYFGTRSDDPNDIVPHQNRRELRGMHVFAAWLNHNDSRSINTLDTLVEEGGSHYVRHYVMDFGATLGSASTSKKPARTGGEYYLDFKPAPKQVLTLGLAVPYWARGKYPSNPSVGNFDSAAFNPEKWIPDYPNAAFLNRLPDDEFWAAKQVMAFTDEQIRTLVKVAQYSDPHAEKYVADTLIARRDKIGKVYLSKVLPLDRFAVENGRLTFHDLAQERDLEANGPVHITWSSFDNQTGQKASIPAAQDFQLPADPVGSYLAADLWRGEDKKKTVTVYLKVADNRAEVVGLDRTW